MVPSQGPERLQVLLELADGVYGIGLQLTELEIDEELKRISPHRAAIKELFTRSRLSTRTPSSTALALAVLSLSRPPSEYVPHIGIFNNGRIYDRVAERFTLKARERAAPAEPASRPARRSSRQGIGEAFLKSAARSVGRSLGTRLIRGILGSLLK